MTDNLYWGEKSFRDIIGKMRFSYLRISLTKDCNAHCGFCHNEGQKMGLRGDDAHRQRATMTNQQLEYLADFLKSVLRKFYLQEESRL